MASSYATFPVQWVDKFTYLGKVISRQNSDYMELNLDPVLAGIKPKLRGWSNLTLSLLGHINLLKMKILPKFTYLPLIFFIKFNVYFSCLYGDTNHPVTNILPLPGRN